MSKKIGRGILIWTGALLLLVSSVALAQEISPPASSAKILEKIDKLQIESVETRKIMLESMEIATRARQDAAEFKEVVLVKIGLWRGRVAQGMMMAAEAKDAASKVGGLEIQLGDLGAKVQGLEKEISTTRAMVLAANREIEKVKDQTNSLLDRVKKLEDELAKKPEVKLAPKNVYRVEKGDSLWKISSYRNIYNDPYQWKKIYQANRDKVKNPDLIYIGQRLVIPPKNLHRVLKGENLFEISNYESVYNDPWEWRNIFEANRDKIKDPNLIRPGQLLVIPQE